MAVLDLGKVVPEKGVDYFTESDINTIESEVVEDVKETVKVSDLQNDAGYITKDVNNLTNYTKSSDLASVATSGKASDLTNDSGFVDNTVDDLVHYTLGTSTGSTIELSINSSTYVMTLNLKNSAGTTISTDSIDLPLETMVVGATYDSTNKKIVLTLKNGETIDVPVGDLVSGLQTEITNDNKLSSDLVDDTNHTNKFVTSSDITKLSGIETGAQVNKIETISVNGTAQTISNKNVDLQIDLDNAMYLGKVTDFTSSNRLDLDQLDAGVYYIIIGKATGNYSIYLKATNFNDEVVNGYYEIPKFNDSFYVNSIITLTMFKKTSDVTGANDNFGNLEVMCIDNTNKKIMSAYNKMYFIGNGKFSTGYSHATMTIDELNTAQTITAKKTFNVLPETSIAPTSGNQLTNKTYVDSVAQTIQYSTMPTASTSNLGQIVQYTGTTDSTYTNGYYYQCVSDGASTPTYSWENIEVQPSSVANVSYLIANFPSTRVESRSYIILITGSENISSYYWDAMKDVLVSAINDSRILYPKKIYFGIYMPDMTFNTWDAYDSTSTSTQSTRYKVQKFDGQYKESNVYIFNNSGTINFNLSYNDLTSNLSSWNVYTYGAQTIEGVKTFSSLPQSSVTPSNNNDLVNKSYVDSAISSAITDALGGNY